MFGYEKERDPNTLNYSGDYFFGLDDIDIYDIMGESARVLSEEEFILIKETFIEKHEKTLKIELQNALKNILKEVLKSEPPEGATPTFIVLNGGKE
jgi:hypothetical protein